MTARGRLLLADALGLVVEGAAITVPAVLLYGLAYGNPSLSSLPVGPSEVLQLGPQLARPVIATLLLFSIIYFLWQDAWLRRLRRTRDPAAHRDLVYATAASLPRHSHLVRTLLWTLCGLLCVGWLSRAAGLRAWPLLWLFSLNPLLAGALHSMAYDRLLWGVPWRSLPGGPDPLRRLAARYRDELARATLLTTGLCIVLTVALTSPIPFHLERYQSTQRYLPGLLLGFLFLGHLARVRGCAPIDDYLRIALTPYPPSRALALAALGAAQRLPYLLGGVMVAGGSLIALLVFLLLLHDGDVPPLHLGLLLGVSLCTVQLCALGAALWHRSTLRPLLQHLLGRPVRADRHHSDADWPPQASELPAPLSLAARTVGSFGLLVLCGGALTLQWGLIQFNNLATQRIQTLATQRLDDLLADLSRAAPTPDQAPQAIAALARAAHLHHESLLFYLGPDLPRSAQLLSAPEGLPAPQLPASVVTQMQRRRTGNLALPQVQLAGVFTRVRLSPAGPGVPAREATLALFYPDYRHPGEGGLAPASGQRTALLLFCAVLLFASGGIVAVTTVALARPVRYLERRATAIAGGDLLRPVRQALVDTDELGRLTLAFEEMRRALADKLRQSTQLNLALEAEVSRRTQELTRRNQEVSEALGRLRQARDELLRTERLATMGRIAAGVSSEINNPVNVMANLCDPLSEELAALRQLVAQERLPVARTKEVLADLRRMVDAVLRGAERAKEIVQATRIHLRNAGGAPEPLLVAPLLDAVLMLFADLRHHGVAIQRDYAEGLQALAVRGDLAQLISGWLSRVTPRLRQAAQRPGSAIELRLQTRRHAAPDEDAEGPFAEILISDNGPAIQRSEVAAITQAESNLASRLAARLEVYSDPGGTRLRLRLPLALPPSPAVADREGRSPAVADREGRSPAVADRAQ